MTVIELPGAGSHRLQARPVRASSERGCPAPAAPALLCRPLGPSAPVAFAGRATGPGRRLLIRLRFGGDRRGGPPGRVVIGVERDPEHLEAARRSFPWLTIIDARRDRAAGRRRVRGRASILLDVIEHIAEPRDVIAEAHRVLRPGGVLVVERSPPRAAALARRAQFVRSAPPPVSVVAGARGCDRVRRRRASPLPGRGARRALLAPSFSVDRVARTGLGLQELVTIALLVIRVGAARAAIARALLPLHLLVYIADDLIPAGPLGISPRGPCAQGSLWSRAVSARVLFTCWPFEGHRVPAAQYRQGAARARRRGGVLHRRAARARRSRSRDSRCSRSPGSSPPGCGCSSASGRCGRPPPIAAGPASGIPRMARRDDSGPGRGPDRRSSATGDPRCSSPMPRCGDRALSCTRRCRFRSPSPHR